MNDSTLKPELLERYAGNRRIFIETGTARGEGLQVALEHGFERLFSIEANPDLFSAALTRFMDNPKVTVFFGDGGQVLPQVLRHVEEPAVFWLDSHWSTGEAPLAPGVSSCPLLSELRAIAEHPIKDHVILVDDIRYFWRGIAQWNNVNVAQIVQIIMEANPFYSIRFEEGVTPLDILVATLHPNERPVHEAVEAYE